MSLFDATRHTSPLIFTFALLLNRVIDNVCWYSPTVGTLRIFVCVFKYEHYMHINNKSMSLVIVLYGLNVVSTG